MKKLFLFCLVFSQLFSVSILAKEKPKAPKSKGAKIYKVDWAKSLKTSGSKKRYFPDVATPTVDSGRVFVGSHGGDFYSIDESTGRVLWRVDSGGPIASKPLVSGEIVVVGNNKGLVNAYDISSGSKVFTSYVGSEVLTQPVSAGGSIYVITTAREVFSISRDSGQVQWSSVIKGFDTRFTMRGNSSLILANGHLYVGMSDGQVVSLSLSGGQVLWSTNLATGQEPFKDIDANLLLDGNSIYAVGYFGYLVKLDASDGHVIYKRECRSGTNMSLSGDLLAVSTTSGHVVAFDKNSGQRQWDIPLYSGTLSAPVISNNTVVVGARSGQIYVLALDNGTVLQTIPMGSGYMGQAVGNDGRLFALSATAKLYSMSPR